MAIPDNYNTELCVIKYNDLFPVQSAIDWIQLNFYDIWTELRPYRKKIHHIYAGLGEPQFHYRSLESIHEEIRFEYAAGKRNFVFSCLDEGLAAANIIHIHNLLPLINDILPNITLIHATGAHDGPEQYRRYCEKNNLPQVLNIVCGSHFEKNCKPFLYSELKYKETKKTKKFLSFNKVDRQHRITLFEKLLELDLVKDAYYSFDILENNLNILRTDIWNQFSNIVSIADSLPLVLNRSPERDNPVDIRADDLKYFNETYFSVVTETLFYDMIDPDLRYYYVNTSEVFGTFPTEKTYKCLALGHPFISVSTCGFLKTLRGRGYKTFSPFIDESYDDIVNDHDRMDAIVNEINRLCSLSQEELDQFILNVEPILEHNRQQFAIIGNNAITKDILSLLK